ncbi:hypothetical protein LWC34_45160 [Kibdelosporangium philippinense]|uniref:Uncharacterized protein n=2 Tax=Kibdelosporangium philippinense TaxID=211113 RepID=A0ABS8ZQC3_9PSEU|nr:hypothetical protein [Kibdelosporangium philippinense]MCE7009949.1 hypothetical protein [Kibdelosporangium philippinense]
MSKVTEQSTVDQFDRTTGSQPSIEEVAVTKTVSEMAADQAPKMFAIALEYHVAFKIQFVAWGMAFDGYAYVVMYDGNMQFLTTDADGALKCFPKTGNVTPRLIWVGPSPATGQG